MPQEAHLRCRLQKPNGRFAGALAQRSLTKRSREFRKAEVQLRRILLRTPVNSPCATAIHVYAKNESVLEDLLHLLERTEDHVAHLLGVRGTNRVGATLDLHNLASLGPLSHEAVHL